MTIVHAGVGPVSLSDVDLAETCGASIICFNTRSMPAAVEAATRQANIDVILLLTHPDIFLYFKILGFLSFPERHANG